MAEIPDNYAAYPRAVDPRLYFGPPAFRIEAIGEAWNILKSDPVTWIVGLLVIIIASVLIQSPAQFVTIAETLSHPTQPRPPSSLSMSLTAIFGLLAAGGANVLYGGYYRILFARMRLNYESLGGMFNLEGQGGKLFWWGVLASLPTMLISIIYSATINPQNYGPGHDPFAGLTSLLLMFVGLIVVGLIMFPFLLTSPILVDQKLSIIESAKLSWKTVCSSYFPALGLYLCAGIVATLGVVACGIGLLVTLPLFTLAVGVAYRDHFIPPITTAASVPNFEVPPR